MSFGQRCRNCGAIPGEIFQSRTCHVSGETPGGNAEIISLKKIEMELQSSVIPRPIPFNSASFRVQIL